MRIRIMVTLHPKRYGSGVETRTPDDRDRDRALAYENVRDVIFLVGVEGERFRFLEVNPAFTTATGLPEEAVVGKLVDDVIPEPSLGIVLENYRTAIREGRTVRWEEMTEYPSGRRCGQVSVTPVVDAEGRCTRLVGTVHDVTAEVRARAMAAAEQRVLEMVATGATLASTLEALVLAVEGQTPPAIASILLMSPDGSRVVHGAAPNLPDDFNREIDGAPVGPRAGSCGTAAALRRSVIVEDIEVDPLWEAYRDLARRNGLRACWSTPVLSSDGRVLGTFALYYRERRSPRKEDLELIERVVHVAGIAIQRHVLDDQLRALSTRIDAAREEERTGIAREIHDQLGQSLTVLKMDLAWIARRAGAPNGIGQADLLGKVGELANMTDEIIGQIRRISAELRPGLLDDLGLAAALSWQAEEFEKHTGVLCAVDVRLDRQPLQRELSTMIFRAVQEALTNVARHAQAMRADVVLEEADGWLVLQIRDDGRGIRAEDIRDPRALGLLGMRERARRLGGSVEFTPGGGDGRGGTVVTFRLPLGEA
jgi:PAS domain S-box-containing protein